MKAAIRSAPLSPGCNCGKRLTKSLPREQPIAPRVPSGSVDPMVRAALFHVEDDEHVFVLILHHIVCDGPSMAILLEELALFYRGFLNGKPVHIPELRVQYADFAVWQREIVAEIRDEQVT